MDRGAIFNIQATFSLLHLTKLTFSNLILEIFRNKCHCNGRCFWCFLVFSVFLVFFVCLRSSQLTRLGKKVDKLEEACLAKTCPKKSQRLVRESKPTPHVCIHRCAFNLFAARPSTADCFVSNPVLSKLTWW